MPAKKKARAPAAKKRARSPSPAESDSSAPEGPANRQAAKKSGQPSALEEAITQVAFAVSALAQRSAAEQPAGHAKQSTADPVHDSEPELSSLMLLPAAQLVQSPQSVPRVLAAIRDPMERATKVDAILTAIETNFLTFKGDGTTDARGRRIEEEVFQPIRELLAIAMGPADVLVPRMTEYLVRRAQWAHVLATRGHEVAATLLREAKCGTARRDPHLAKALSAPHISASAARAEPDGRKGTGRQAQGRGGRGAARSATPEAGGATKAGGRGRARVSPTKSERKDSA
jgi:hypothetical protein